MSLEARIEKLPHLKLNLPGDLEGNDIPCHRPPLSVWADVENAKPVVTLTIGALWGQPIRFAEMTAEEARTLAGQLYHMADQITVLDHLTMMSAALEGKSA